jgi:uncharacterized protein YciI
MKKLFLVAIIGLFVFFVSAKDHAATTAENRANDTPRMKQYWLVMLLKGSNRTHDKATAQRIQTKHIANIERLAAEGKIIMAGPMGYTYDADLRGLFIMDAKDSATAASYVKTDSAVITGRLRFEVHPWWTQTGSYIFK